MILEVDDEEWLPKPFWAECIRRRDGFRCAHCGSGEVIHVHHINHDGKDNRLNNGESLCRSCHSKHHIHHRCRERAEHSAVIKRRVARYREAVRGHTIAA